MTGPATTEHHGAARSPAQRSPVDPILVDRVRARLAAAGGPPTPTAVAAAVRAEAGGVATDLDVLAALRVLRQEFAGAGPLDELLRDPRTTDVLVCGGGTVWIGPGRGAGASRRAPARRGGGATAGPAARAGGGPPPRRREPVRRRLARRRRCAGARGPRTGRRRRHVPVAAGAATRGPRSHRPARRRHPGSHRGGPPAVGARRPAGAARVRRHGRREDDVAQRPARRGRSAGTDRPGRRQRGAASPAPARRPARGARREHRGGGRCAAARPGPPRPAHAAGPARRG